MRTSVLLGLSALLAVASAGVVLAQAREHRQSPQSGNAGNAKPMSAGDRQMAVQSSQVSVLRIRASHGGDGQDAGVSILPAAASSWAGPVTPDEKQHIPRKLTSEERDLLRQEIRTAGEEVYEPYRKKKP